ncbi:hypothetical protein R6Q57_007004 [Mikania cordata]
MADESVKAKRQPSRLQRRAPASIQVTPVSQWSAAIPLLSPLATFPEVRRNSCINNSMPEPEKAPVVYKNWQHPAAPFFYEPAPALTLLQSICTVDRS